MNCKALITAALTSVALTVNPAIAQTGFGDWNFPGKFANPWTLKHPVGSGSPLGDKFRREVFVGNMQEYYEYISRNNLRTIEYNSYDGTVHDNGSGTIWAYCMTASVVPTDYAGDTVCVATNGNGEPLDPRILSYNHRQDALKHWIRYNPYR
jgi:hypothetical protein